MKKVITLFTLQLLYFANSSFAADPSIIKLDGVFITYTQNKFTLKGIDYSIDELPPDVFISVFIETGDGNYLSFKVDNGALAGKPGSHQFPKAFYNRTGVPVTYVASVTKHYDGGGPRRKTLSGVISPSGSGSNVFNYPHEPYILQNFPNDIVEKDTITSVFTVRTGSMGEPARTFELVFDRRYLRIASWQCYDSRISKGTEIYQGFYTKVPVTFGAMAANEVLNLFIYLEPINIGDLTPGLTSVDYKVMFNNKAISGGSMPVLNSHDPNRISVISACRDLMNTSSPFISTINLLLEFENIGVGTAYEVENHIFMENDFFDFDIRRCIFSMKDLQREPDGYVQKSMPQPITLLDFESMMEMRDQEISFPGKSLAGTNTLPYGHPRTKGYVWFVWKGPSPYYAPDKMSWVKARVFFKNESMWTKTLAFSIDGLRKACQKKESRQAGGVSVPDLVNKKL